MVASAPGRQRAQPAQRVRPRGPVCRRRVFARRLSSRSTSGAALAASLPRSLQKTQTSSSPAQKLFLVAVRHNLKQRANTAKRSQQNDGLPRELTRDYRRPPGADRLHERAAYRGTSLLSLHQQLPFLRGRGAPPRPAAPSHAAATPPRQRHRRASRTLSRPRRPPRPRTRPQN